MKLQSQPAIQQHDEANYRSYKVNDQGTTDEEKKKLSVKSLAELMMKLHAEEY